MFVTSIIFFEISENLTNKKLLFMKILHDMCLSLEISEDKNWIEKNCRLPKFFASFEILGNFLEQQLTREKLQGRIML